MTKTIVDIEVVDAEKRRVPSKHYVYVIKVKWSDNSSMVVYRRYSRFFDLQTQLLEKFPVDAGAVDPSLRIIPFLPGKIFFGRSQIRDVAMKRLKEIDAYCKNLLKLPPHISQCEEVLEFFEVEQEDIEPPKEEKNERRFSLGTLGKQKGEKKAGMISGPKQLEQYLAVADYVSQEKGEMNLQAGMVVEVTEKSESGWWFVNAEEQQGWVPSTYLQPLDGSASSQAPVITEGQEERYICIEVFTAENEDEMSLEKGVLVEVLQKSMDGWWRIRYQDQEGFAPATYLKKSSDPQAKNLVEKSRQSGVKIIGNLADVSNLMAGSSSPRNSAIFSGNGARDSVSMSAEANGKTVEKSIVAREESDVSEDEWDDEGKDVLQQLGPKGDSATKVMLKQRSLERGGSLKPPPRQNSFRVVQPTPPSPSTKSATYITIADFADTVGDGISFSVGESVTVLEKTSSGWWFVERGQDKGWVPESYLEQSSTTDTEGSSHQVDTTAGECSEENSDESDEDEQAQSPSAALANALWTRSKDVSNNRQTSESASSGGVKLPGKATSKLPPLPSKPQQQSQLDKDSVQVSRDKTDHSQFGQPAAGLAAALKSKFESKSEHLPSKPADKSKPPELPTKSSDKPKPSGPSFKSSDKPKPSGPSFKSSDKPKPPGPSFKTADKPKPSGPSFKTADKPKPPGLPSKPPGSPSKPELPNKSAEKPRLPSVSKHSERQVNNGESGHSGLASALKSKFESQQPDDKTSVPTVKLSQQSKPALPSKSFGGLHSKPGFPQKPSNGSKAAHLWQNDGSQSEKPTVGPKMPSKPQASFKPSSDPNNNNASSVNRAASKVHNLAATFNQKGTVETSASSRDNNSSRPTLPSKKPSLAQPSKAKPGNKDFESVPGKPRVGNLVSELGSKLQFGGGGGGGGSIKGSGNESQPAQRKHSESSAEASSVNKVAPQQQSNRHSSNTPAASDSRSGKEYEAVADFTATGEGELDLRCGDIVQVLNQKEGDWWLAKLNGVEGWVPRSYLEPAAEWDD